MTKKKNNEKKELTERQKKIILRKLDSINEALGYTFESLRDIYSDNVVLMNIIIKDLK